MYIESFNRKVAPGGGYGGYDVIIVDDDGKRHGVLALPRDHSGKNAIHQAAYAALNKEAITQQKATIDKAAEIMQQIEEQKEAEEQVDAIETIIDAAPEDVPKPGPVDIARMKFFELKAHAKSLGVEVTKKSKKADILKALENKGKE